MEPPVPMVSRESIHPPVQRSDVQVMPVSQSPPSSSSAPYERAGVTSVARPRSPRAVRAIARVAVVAAFMAVLVPLEQPDSWSTPVTLSETIDGLDAADGAGSGDGEVSLSEVEALQQSEIIEAPLSFSMIGFQAPPEVESIAVRTSVDGESWEPWEVAEFIEEVDGPDDDADEGRRDDLEQHTEPLWVGEADHLQVEVEGGSPEDLEVTVIDSMHLNDGPVERHSGSAVGSSADADGIDMVSRQEWGANESLGSSTRTVNDVHMGVVHHTAHASGSRANSYSRSEAPGLVRAMHQYHTNTLGWADLGYNVLVDRFGTIYEGRKGGFGNGVVGAHARGFNTGSFGVAVIGNFVDVQASPEAIESLTEVVAAKSAIHGIDPTSTTTRMGDGTRRPTILGHRDVGNTACPGRIQQLLPQIRSEAEQEAQLFPDVPLSSVHRESVLALAESGVTNGCAPNLFCPTHSLTRGQAASFIVRSFDVDPLPGNAFPDVPSDNPHSEAINALVEEGWLLGYEDGRFGPYDELSRGQLATLLSRSLPPADEIEGGNSDGWVEHYEDVSTSSSHFHGIMALAEQGIRGNCGAGRFCPDDDVLRDSTATFVHEVRKLHGLE